MSDALAPHDAPESRAVFLHWLNEMLGSRFQATVALLAALPHQLQRAAGLFLLVWLALWALPVLSIWVMLLSVELVRLSGQPQWADKLRSAAAEFVRSGYAIEESIDKKGEKVSASAQAHATTQLQRNNQSLDYVQFFDLRLDRHAPSKSVPLALNLRQHARVKVQRVAYEPLAGAASTLCTVADLGPTSEVLSISLDRIELGTLRNDKNASDNRFELRDQWWKQHLDTVRNDADTAVEPRTQRLKLRPGDLVARSLADGCAMLLVEMEVEVHKMGLGQEP